MQCDVCVCVHLCVCVCVCVREREMAFELELEGLLKGSRLSDVNLWIVLRLLLILLINSDLGYILSSCLVKYC